MKISTALLLVLAALPALAQREGSFVDPRDGQRYSTVTYSLSELSGTISDLDEYGTYLAKMPVQYKVTRELPPSLTWMSTNLNFAAPESKCFQEGEDGCAHGRLYSWGAATKVCPAGWHLPTDDEWFLLAHLYGGVETAGQHLKSARYGGTNKSLFGLEKPYIFWSSDQLDDDNALDWKVNFRWTKLQRWKGGKSAFNSVRCVKDDS